MAFEETRFKYHFDNTTTGPTIETSYEERLTVDRSIEVSRNCFFNVVALPDAFLDLSKIYLRTEFKITDEAGNDLGPDPSVFLKHDFGCSLWSSVLVSLNNVPIQSCNDYPITSRLVSLIGSTSDQRRDVQTPLAGLRFPFHSFISAITHLGLFL